MGWTVRGSNPGGACLDRPWGPPSLLYNGYRLFPGVKYGRGVLLTTHPLLVSRSWKSRAIPLPTLWATPRPVRGNLYLYLYINSDSFPQESMNRVVYLMDVEFTVWYELNMGINQKNWRTVDFKGAKLIKQFY